MKFGKEFTSQRVPEWEGAYMNYSYLKTILNEILIFRRWKQKQSPPSPFTPRRRNLLKKSTFYRAFSGLTNRHSNYSKNDDEDEAILVSEMQQQELPAPEVMSYQTLFLRPSEEGAENELVFFRKLDDEFNKVINFYRGKVEEVVVEAEDLNKQMDAFIALQVKINDPNFQNSSPSPSSNSGENQ